MTCCMFREGTRNTQLLRAFGTLEHVQHHDDCQAP